MRLHSALTSGVEVGEDDFASSATHSSWHAAIFALRFATLERVPLGPSLPPPHVCASD